MSTSLSRPPIRFIAAVLFGCSLIGCDGKTASVASVGTGSATGDTATSTLTSTSTDTGSNVGGASSTTGSPNTQMATGTYTHIVSCSFDAGPCGNLADAGVLPLPAPSDLVRVEFSSICDGDRLVHFQVASTDASSIASLYGWVFAGLATLGQIGCIRSCPPVFNHFTLSFFDRNGHAVTARLIPGVCGGVSIDGTDCVPHPGDVTSILTQIGATLALDAGDVMPQGINNSYCPN